MGVGRCGRAPRVHVQESPAGQSSAAAANPIEQAVSRLVSLEPETNRPVLSIPLPESISGERLTAAFARPPCVHVQEALAFERWRNGLPARSATPAQSAPR